VLAWGLQAHAEPASATKPGWEPKLAVRKRADAPWKKTAEPYTRNVFCNTTTALCIATLVPAEAGRPAVDVFEF